MHKEISFHPMHSLNHFIPHRTVIGLHIPIVPNLKQLTSYIDALRWVQDKLTPLWIYGQQLYLSQIWIMPSAKCLCSGMQNIYTMLLTTLHWLGQNGWSSLSSIQVINHNQTGCHGWTNHLTFGFVIPFRAFVTSSQTWTSKNFSTTCPTGNSKLTTPNTNIKTSCLEIWHGSMR